MLEVHGAPFPLLKSSLSIFVFCLGQFYCRTNCNCLVTAASIVASVFPLRLVQTLPYTIVCSMSVTSTKTNLPFTCHVRELKFDGNLNQEWNLCRAVAVTSIMGYIFYALQGLKCFKSSEFCGVISTLASKI